jgi:Asp/Glu/hydantoin racemase
MVGERFGVVAFDRAIAEIVEREIARLGLASRAVPVEVVDTDYGGVVEAFDRPDRLIDAFTNAARRAIARGAESIIPGQTIMAEILWHQGVRRIDETPVIDALGVTIATAELLVRLRRAAD